MKTFQTIEQAARLAFSADFINADKLRHIAEAWQGDNDARGLALNISEYADAILCDLETIGGVILEYDAWEVLLVEVERLTGLWVSLYCNEISWSNRPEWLADSVRAALNEPTNTPTTMDANETTEFSELSHAGQCLDIYLHNTAEIYKRYTVPAIEDTAKSFRYRNGAKYTADEYWGVLERTAEDMHAVKNALQAAARLVKKYDHMTPTAKDIEQVTRNYAAYIVDCAKNEIEQ